MSKYFLERGVVFSSEKDCYCCRNVFKLKMTVYSVLINIYIYIYILNTYTEGEKNREKERVCGYVVGRNLFR